MTHPSPAAIIFDFDGVMFDTEFMHGQAFVDVLQRYGVDIDLQASMREFIGHNDWLIVERLIERHAGLAELTAADLVDEKTRRYSEITGDGLEPLPGLRAFIERWVGRVPMGICSGSRTREIDRLLRLAGLREPIDVIVSSDDVKVSKPDPAGYLMTRELLAGDGALVADRCLVFEDSPAGVRAARAAGMATVGVRRSYMDEAALGAPVLVDDFAELVDGDTEAKVFRAAGLQ